MDTLLSFREIRPILGPKFEIPRTIAYRNVAVAQPKLAPTMSHPITCGNFAPEAYPSQLEQDRALLEANNVHGVSPTSAQGIEALALLKATMCCCNDAGTCGCGCESRPCTCGTQDQRSLLEKLREEARTATGQRDEEGVNGTD